MDHRHERVYFYLIACIIVVYPFSLKLCNVAILVCTLHWLVWIIRKPERFTWKRSVMWLLIGLYLLTAATIFYSANIKMAVFELDKKFPILLLPLVIGTSPILTRKQFERLIFLCIASVTVALIFCLCAATYRWWMKLPGGFFWKDLTSPLGEFHPAYLSLYINFLIGWTGMYLLDRWGTESRPTKLCLSMCLALFYLCIVLLGSKVHLIIAAGLPILLAIRYTHSIRLGVVIAVLIFALGVCAWLIKGSYTWERFTHISTLSYQLNAPVSTFNEFTIRLALAECSWEILKDNFFLGVGAGDVYDELDKVFRRVDYKYGYLDQQNPHNEYLSQWLSNGIPGLGLLLTLLIVFYVKAVKKRQMDLLILLTLFTIGFLFESMLERQKGVVLFSLLMSLYAYQRPVDQYLQEKGCDKI